MVDSTLNNIQFIMLFKVESTIVHGALWENWSLINITVFEEKRIWRGHSLSKILYSIYRVKAYEEKLNGYSKEVEAFRKKEVC